MNEALPPMPSTRLPGEVWPADVAERGGGNPSEYIARSGGARTASRQCDDLPQSCGTGIGTSCCDVRFLAAAPHHRLLSECCTRISEIVYEGVRMGTKKRNGLARGEPVGRQLSPRASRVPEPYD